MSRRAGRNYRDEGKQSPDCCTCIHRTTCQRAAEGTFCTMWQGREPQPQGEDPNEKWKRGEEVEF